VDELLRKFKANLYMARKTSEVCPSKWKDEGDKTLTPSADMGRPRPRGPGELSF
jgi:NADH-dependent peroxiredoxin subunit C